MEVEYKGNGRWEVASEYEYDVKHDVRLRKGVYFCSCKGFKFDDSDSDCKHITRVKDDNFQVRVKVDDLERQLQELKRQLA